MKKTLQVLNDLKDRALVDDYAIGGGVATIFYTEPVFTYDLDVFVVVKPELERKIISLVPVYDYLTSKGCVWKGEHILIEGFPVQFIPASAGIEREAVEHAKKVAYSGVGTRVLSAEYLIAIALKVGRRKDFEKVTRLFGQSKIDKGALKKILQKYRLLNRFKKWKEK